MAENNDAMGNEQILGQGLNCEELLIKHFDNNNKFEAHRAKWWSQEDTARFCRLVRAVNNAGLDLYFVDTNPIQVRFGRKNIRSARALNVLGIVFFNNPLTIKWRYDVGGKASHKDPMTLTDDLVNETITALQALDNIESADPNYNWIRLNDNHPNALWPDQLEIEQNNGVASDNQGSNVKEPLDKGADAKDHKRMASNVIYYGPPGTGKTYKLSERLKDEYEDTDPETSEVNKRYTFVTFHQSYGYEEFVEGLRPILDQNTNTESGSIKYEIRPGAFKQLCDEARNTPNQRYAMVIDEINRGNISKILGELITLIEPDKREGEDNKLEVTLPYSGKPFSVPSNVDIIGSMNTADRSLALLDTALRRRFDFVPVLPDASLLKGIQVMNIDFQRMLDTINKRIEALYDRDHCIGHAYFTPLKSKKNLDMEDLAHIFKNRIIPLLEEYFFEDWQKIRLVLADNQKPKDVQFVREVENQDQGLKSLFGKGQDSDSFLTKPCFERNEGAFNKPEAYIGIYDKLPAS